MWFLKDKYVLSCFKVDHSSQQEILNRLRAFCFYKLLTLFSSLEFSFKLWDPVNPKLHFLRLLFGASWIVSDMKGEIAESGQLSIICIDKGTWMNQTIPIKKKGHIQKLHMQSQIWNVVAIFADIHIHIKSFLWVSKDQFSAQQGKLISIKSS